MVVPSGFEPESPAPKASMIDHYTTGLYGTPLNNLHKYILFHHIWPIAVICVFDILQSEYTSNSDFMRTRTCRWRSIPVVLIVLFMLSVIPMAELSSEDVSGEAYDGYSVGDTLTIYSGKGTTKHNDKQDVSAYSGDSKVTMVFTVTSVPKGYDDWNDYGTLKMTEITFGEDADLVYVFSYIVQKVNKDGKSMYAYFKITDIDGEAKAVIDSRTTEIVLPTALRDIDFSSSVTKVTEGCYVDTKGNAVHYNVDETATVYHNGYGGYSMYTNAADPDLRYCEQGTVTKVDYAAGQTGYDTKMCNWTKNDLTCCDRWVCGSFADMIGAVMTYEITFEGDNVQYSMDSVRCGSNAKITVDGNTLKVNAYEITASYDSKYTSEGWSVEDGTTVTGDMKVSFRLEEGQPGDNNTAIIVAAIVIAVIAIAAGVLVFRARR